MLLDHNLCESRTFKKNEVIFFEEKKRVTSKISNFEFIKIDFNHKSIDSKR